MAMTACGGSSSSADTKAACALTADAVACGADALFAITPYCNKGTADGILEHYRRIAAVLKEGHIRQLVAQGMDEEKAAKKAEKMAIEDARFVLPNACTTKMIVTMNARSLHNFFHHRCCNRAQWEIRELAEQMFKLVYEVAPALFEAAGPSCVAGPCPEGKMSCGRADEMRAHYAALKKGANR